MMKRLHTGIMGLPGGPRPLARLAGGGATSRNENEFLWLRSELPTRALPVRYPRAIRALPAWRSWPGRTVVRPEARLPPGLPVH